MKERERQAEAVAWQWKRGECHYCGIRDEQVDGDRIRWIDWRRRVCSRPDCVRQFEAAIVRRRYLMDQQRRAFRRVRRRKGRAA